MVWLKYGQQKNIIVYKYNFLYFIKRWYIFFLLDNRRSWCISSSNRLFINGYSNYQQVNLFFFRRSILSVFGYTSGSDGLLKLWDIKTSTCVKSIDAHEGKIWGMSASTDENLLVTCASDSSVTIWRVSKLNRYLLISFTIMAKEKFLWMNLFILGFDWRRSTS